MFDPAWEEGCPVCSYQADNVGPLAHLHARNTTYAAGGVSVFLRDGGTVLHTWSGYGPVIYLLCETEILLDLTPLCRQDEHVQLLRHDKYPEDGHD